MAGSKNIRYEKEIFDFAHAKSENRKAGTKLALAVSFKSIPFYSGTIDYTIEKADAPDAYKINLRFVKQAPRLLQELSQFMYKEIGNNFLARIPEASIVNMEAQKVHIPDREYYANNWDVVIYPLLRHRAKLILEVIIETIQSKFRHG